MCRKSTLMAAYSSFTRKHLLFFYEIRKEENKIKKRKVWLKRSWMQRSCVISSYSWPRISKCQVTRYFFWVTYRWSQLWSLTVSRSTRNSIHTCRIGSQAIGFPARIENIAFWFNWIEKIKSSSFLNALDSGYRTRALDPGFVEYLFNVT